MSITFIHKGPLPLYLLGAILSARWTDRSARILLIGDDSSFRFKLLLRAWRIDFHRLSELAWAGEEFAQKFKPNLFPQPDYELFCYQRWFILNRLLENLGATGPVMCLDSDAILCGKLSDFAQSIKSDVAVSNLFGPAFTFFREPKQLKDYTRQILSSWGDETSRLELQAFVNRLGHPGLPHPSDMATLARYLEGVRSEDLCDSLRENLFVIENLQESLDYRDTELNPIPEWTTKGAYFRDRLGRRVVTAGGVHLQGGTKKLWPKFMRPPILFVLALLFPVRVARALEIARED